MSDYIDKEFATKLKHLLFSFRHYKRMTNHRRNKIDMNDFLEWLESFDE